MTEPARNVPLTAEDVKLLAQELDLSPTEIERGLKNLLERGLITHWRPHTPAPAGEQGHPARALSWQTTSAFVEAAKIGSPTPPTNGDEGANYLASIAESLKRIADTLDGTSAGKDIAETIFGGRP